MKLVNLPVYQTIDKRIFKTEQEALDHEFLLFLRKELNKRLPEPYNSTLLEQREALKDILYRFWIEKQNELYA